MGLQLLCTAVGVSLLLDEIAVSHRVLLAHDPPSSETIRLEEHLTRAHCSFVSFPSCPSSLSYDSWNEVALHLRDVWAVHFCHHQYRRQTTKSQPPQSSDLAKTTTDNICSNAPRSRATPDVAELKG